MSFDDPEFPYVKYWGEKTDLKSSNIKFYIPNKETFDAARTLFSKYFYPQLDLLERYTQDKVLLTK